jgi:hypothetical protein
MPPNARDGSVRPLSFRTDKHDALHQSRVDPTAEAAIRAGDAQRRILLCLVREENANALPGGPHPPIPSGCTATLGHLKRDQISLIDQGPNIRKEKLVVVPRLLGRGIAAKDRAHEFRLAVDDDPAPDT